MSTTTKKKVLEEKIPYEDHLLNIKDKLPSIKYKDWYINQSYVPQEEDEDYDEFWEFQEKLCKRGFFIEDTYFSGFLYWHLNFWRTEITKKDEFGDSYEDYTQPTFRDNEWLISNGIAKAKYYQKGLAIGGSRRISKSVFISSFLSYNSSLDAHSQNLFVGLNGDDIGVTTKKISKGLDDIPEYFKWMRIREDWTKEVTLGVKDTKGTKKPFSQIFIRNIENGKKEEAIAGTKPRSFVIEEAGKGSWLRGFKAAVPGFTTDTGWGCSPLVIFTGGDMEKYHDAKNVFMNPYSHNFLEYECLERKRDAFGRIRKHGLFLGNKYRQEAKYLTTFGDYLDIENKKSDLYNIPFWASDEEYAEKILSDELEKLKTNPDRMLYHKEVMYFPRTVDDIFLNVGSNMYNTKACVAQQQRLQDLGITGIPVELYSDGEKICWKESDKEYIREWPVETQSKDAPIMIYEMPEPNAPKFLYVAGCLTPGEKVLTDVGLKKVEDVSVNDKLVSKDGEYVDIINLQRYLKKEEPTFNFKMSHTFRKTNFTQEHPIYVSKPGKRSDGSNDEKFFNFDFVPAKDVKLGMWVKYPNMYKSTNDFDFTTKWSDDGIRIDRINENPLTNPDFWWVCGLILGDGWCAKSDSDSKICVSFNSSEVEFYKKFEGIVKNVFNRSFSYRQRGNCIEYTFSHQQFHSFFKENFGFGADGKFISEWVKRIPDNLKLQLVLGYLASDGCVSRNNITGLYSTEFVSVSLELLEGIQDILFSLGIVSSMNKLRDAGVHTFGERKCPTKETYHLRLSGSQSIILAKLDEGRNQKLRKVDTDRNLIKTKQGCFLSECGDYIYIQIKGMEKSTYSGWVYNFECDTNTFLCRGITTHNCDPYTQSSSANSDSLGAIYIYKRMHSLTGEGLRDSFVASYVARPDDQAEWEENARLLLMFYNAYCLVENDEPSFCKYMIERGCAELYLSPQPKLYSTLVPNGTQKRPFGLSRQSPQIREYLNGALKKYLDEVIYTEVDDNGIIQKEYRGVTKVPDHTLLSEIIGFAPGVNVDRQVAASLAIAMAKELDPLLGTVIGEESKDRAETINKAFNNLKKKTFSGGGSTFSMRSRKTFKR